MQTRVYGRMARRSLFALALLLAGPVPSPAADALAHLLACRAIPQAAARLACFDRRSAALAAGHANRAAGAAPARAPSLAPKQTFGLPEGTIVKREVAAGVRAKPLSHLSSRIARITQAADGRLVFTLGDGQEWIQLDVHGDLLARPGEAVTISRQLFGSYWMELSSGRGFKVERVH